jgi:hypothetical protein
VTSRTKSVTTTVTGSVTINFPLESIVTFGDVF